MRVPATPAGYDQPRDFVRSHGRIRMIGIEGTGSYGAGPARALRAAGAPTPGVIRPRAPPAPPRQVRSDRRLRRRRQSTGRGRRPARGQDRHRPLRTDPGAPGRAPQRDEGPRPSPTGRSPPCRPPPPTPCAPASPASAAGSSSTPWPARAPPRPPTAPASATARALRRLARRHRILTDEIADIDTELRALTARAAPTMLATKGCAVNHRHPARRRRRQPRPNPHRGLLRRPVRRRPDPRRPREDQPPPTQPRRRPTGQLGAAPDRPGPPVQRPAHQGPRRPPHRHGQELQRDTAPPPNAPSPAKHGTC